jgi:hypothetical protein
MNLWNNWQAPIPEVLGDLQMALNQQRDDDCERNDSFEEPTGSKPG